MNQKHLLNPRVVAAVLLVILLIGIGAWMRQKEATYPTKVITTGPDVTKAPTPAATSGTATRPAVTPSSPQSTPTQAPSPSPPPNAQSTPRFSIESASPQSHVIISIGGPVTVQIPSFPDGSGVGEMPATLLDAAVRSIEIAGPANSLTVVDSDHRYWLEVQLPADQRTATLQIVSDYLQLASGRNEVPVTLEPGNTVYEIPIIVAPRLPFSPPEDPTLLKDAWDAYLTEAFGLIVDAKSETEY